MDTLKLILRNVFRHRLRSFLTILGVAVAMLSFAMLSTVVEAWYTGVDFAADNRLVTRNKISLIYDLPVAYRSRIAQVEGVSGIGHGIWYGGVYKEKKNFFAQYGISGLDYLDLYPEFVLAREQRRAFATERNAAIAGSKLAERFGWEIGDVIILQGTIYPVDLELVIRGIYEGSRPGIDESVFFFRWDYLNELLKESVPQRADKAGWYIVEIDDPDNAAEIAQRIDTLFANSLAETLTETEKAFQLGFVAMTGAIVTAIRVISLVVIAIILLVLANTMAMTARERTAEYAVLKTLGFGPMFLFILIAGESTSIALIGGTAGALLSLPGAEIFQSQLESFLPAFQVSIATLATVIAVSVGVGVVAALPPMIRATRISISEGLRHMG